MAKITGIPLRKHGAHTFDAFAAAEEEDPHDEHDIAQGDVFSLVAHDVINAIPGFVPAPHGADLEISSIASTVTIDGGQRYRIDPDSLECGEVIMVDSKPYPFQVRGGAKMYCLVAVDVHSRHSHYQSRSPRQRCSRQRSETHHCLLGITFTCDKRQEGYHRVRQLWIHATRTRNGYHYGLQLRSVAG